MLKESRRIYGNLKLRENAGLSGKARSSWALSRVYERMGNPTEGIKYALEAKEILLARGHDNDTPPTQEDFDRLINHVDR